MVDKVRITPDNHYQVLTDDKWVEITKAEYEEKLSNGATEVEYEPEVESYDCSVKFKDGRTLIKVELIDKDNKLLLYFADEDEPEVIKSDAVELYFMWIGDSLRTNRESFIEKLYGDMESHLEEAEETTVDTTDVEAPEEEPEVETPVEEPVAEAVLDTVKDFYNYVSKKENPLDTEFVSKVVTDEGELQSLGGQSFRVYEVSKPLQEDGDVYSRILIGVLDGSEDGVFIAIPDSWQTVSSIEGDVDYEAVNKDISIQAIVSEKLVIEDPDIFYRELGDYYGQGPAYLAKTDVEIAEPEVPSGEEEEEDEGKAELDKTETPVPADIETLSTEDAFAFESTPVRYKPMLKEEWLKEFEATDKFKSKVQSLVEKLSKYLRKNLFSAISFVLSEDENFVAVRVDKKSICDQSLTQEWFKKRITKVCEAIKKYSTDLRIVETRGSYYTRTFFLVEATSRNYVISEDTVIPEISITDNLFEGKAVKLNEQFITAVNNALQEDIHYVVRPTITDAQGTVVESFKVNNNNKVPYIIRLTESEPKIVFISSSLAPVAEDTQASDIALAPAPVALVEPEKEPVITLDSLFTESDSLIANNASSMSTEEDNLTGISVKVLPLDITAGDVSYRILICNVYEQTVFVVPSLLVLDTQEVFAKGTENFYSICRKDGVPVSLGKYCDRFLRVLAVKYLG